MNETNEDTSREVHFVSLITCPSCKPGFKSPFAISTVGVACYLCGEILSFSDLAELLDAAVNQVEKLETMQAQGLSPQESLKVLSGDYDA
jgi:ribosomal protein S27E